MSSSADVEHGPRVVFRYPNFRCYIAARFVIRLGLEIQTIAVAWQIYTLTARPLDLGLVGLSQFLPGMLLFLVAGHAADRYPRQRILQLCYLGFGLCSLLLFGLSLRGFHSIYPVYGVLVVNGIVRAFNAPASQAFLPILVPKQHFTSAVTWTSSLFQVATVTGPVLGGLIYGWAGRSVEAFACAAAAALAGFAFLSLIRLEPAGQLRPAVSLDVLFGGIHYIFRNKIVLGAMSLDMFAVLLGGAVALMPVFARDVLFVGPEWLGILRGAPGVGALTMALLLAFRPLRRNAGATMLACVFLFGIATIVFGFSNSRLLSLGALVALGASDMVSVIIRHSLVQLATPDEMRGRVSAVNVMFIQASNELGEFESGLTAQWFGAVPAVILGGVGTLIVAALWTRLFPALRKVDDLGSLE
jgi:MFS family permease